LTFDATEPCSVANNSRDQHELMLLMRLLLRLLVLVVVVLVINQFPSTTTS